MGWKGVFDTLLPDDVQPRWKQSIAGDNWIRGLQSHLVVPAHENEHHIGCALLEVADPGRDALVFKLQPLQKGGRAEKRGAGSQFNGCSGKHSENCFPSRCIHGGTQSPGSFPGITEQRVPWPISVFLTFEVRACEEVAL